jgi:hypothetical protein
MRRSPETTRRFSAAWSPCCGGSDSQRLTVSV